MRIRGITKYIEGLKQFGSRAFSKLGGLGEKIKGTRIYQKLSGNRGVSAVRGIVLRDPKAMSPIAGVARNSKNARIARAIKENGKVIAKGTAFGLIGAGTFAAIQYLTRQDEVGTVIPVDPDGKVSLSPDEVARLERLSNQKAAGDLWAYIRALNKIAYEYEYAKDVIASNVKPDFDQTLVARAGELLGRALTEDQSGLLTSCFYDINQISKIGRCGIEVDNERYHDLPEIKGDCELDMASIEQAVETATYYIDREVMFYL